MRILDQTGRALEAVDGALGALVQDRLLIAHHDAIPGTAGIGHEEVVRVYPNGGRDTEWVWDKPPTLEAAAWDEYEDILRYIPYTPEELVARKTMLENSAEARLARVEAKYNQLLSALQSSPLLSQLAAAMTAEKEA